MKNAHSSILLQYSQKNDIKCEALEHYVSNRDVIIKKIMKDYKLEKKGDVKQLFLSVMNAGKRDGITDPFFVKFKLECERIHTFISSLNQKLYKEVCKRKNYNTNGSLTNIILCNIKNEILSNAVQYLIKKAIKFMCLSLMAVWLEKKIFQDKEITADLLSGLSEYVMKKQKLKLNSLKNNLMTQLIFFDITETKSGTNIG